MTAPVLMLYNTLTRRIEPFVPQDPECVRMYVCGPTVYDTAHLGNARSLVVFDILYRLLQILYPQVRYVRNITDVDDKITQAAQERGEAIAVLTARTTEALHRDADALGVLRPTIEPKATEHIPHMITMIQQLLDAGHAYAAAGNVLFSVASFPEYGALSGKHQADLLAGARVEVAHYKRHPGDFVLWKPAAESEPGWNSPFGYGRPGWHIECSAMCTEYLGSSFDIHGGGIDLQFPHHENERAQSMCAMRGSSFAYYWVHNGFLTVYGEKMSKSLGNFLTVRDVLDQGYAGATVRLALLGSHYRQPLDWQEKSLDDAHKSLCRWYDALKDYPVESIPAVAAPDATLLEPLLADMNMSRAIAAMHLLARRVVDLPEGLLRREAQAALWRSGVFLGVFMKTPQQWHDACLAETSAHAHTHDERCGMLVEEIEELVALRSTARKNKDYTMADVLRYKLAMVDVVLEDCPDGSTTWHYRGS